MNLAFQFNKVQFYIKVNRLYALNELFHCFFHDDVRLSLGYNTILEFILHVTDVVTICTLTFLDEYKPLYHPEEIGDLYALFRLIVTELRTEGLNLAFQFENIDFLRNVLRVYDSYTWFRCFHEGRQTHRVLLANYHFFTCRQNSNDLHFLIFLDRTFPV